PFIQCVLSSALLSLSWGARPRNASSIIWRSIPSPGQVYDRGGGTDEAARSRRRPPRAPRSDAHREVARAHLWPDTALRCQALDLPLLRAGRARDDVDVDGVPRA